MKVTIEKSWKEELKEEFKKPYFNEINSHLVAEQTKHEKIYPPRPLIFNAFDSTPFNDVQVIILGQDPYHGPGEAMGMCFSVPREIRIPPSLRNIYKELQNDLGIPPASHGDLSSWASQGVFLLNSVLTVRHKSAGSHKQFGWQVFTDRVIEILSERKQNLVFLLWGRYAQSKISLIDNKKHLILKSVHPSPFTGNKFFGNHHFSKTNEYLIEKGNDAINWVIKN